MKLLKFKVPANVLTDESHKDERAIIDALFGEFDESEAWLSKTAACVAGFLSSRISREQAANLMAQVESDTEVLIGGSKSTRTVRIQHRTKSWRNIFIDFRVKKGNEDEELGFIEFSSSSSQQVDDTCQVLIELGATLTQGQNIHATSLNTKELATS